MLYFQSHESPRFFAPQILGSKFDMSLRYAVLTLCTIVISMHEVRASAAEANAKTFNYPVAPTGNVVEDYHGTKVPDPFRPLEDPDSADSRAWIEAENKITFGFLEEIPQREPLKERLTKLWDFEKFS